MIDNDSHPNPIMLNNNTIEYISSYKLLKLLKQGKYSVTCLQSRIQDALCELEHKLKLPQL